VIPVEVCPRAVDGQQQQQQRLQMIPGVRSVVGRRPTRRNTNDALLTPTKLN
jgi:hypothetical protein